MTNLSQWDFSDDFTAVEAALLIRGKDPSQVMGFSPLGYPEAAVPLGDPILARIRRAYELALYEFSVEFEGSDTFDGNDLAERKAWLARLPAEALPCIAMSVTDELMLNDWMFRRLGDDLRAQRFSRDDLAMWLEANKLRSEYQFERSSGSEVHAEAQNTATSKTQPVQSETCHEPPADSTAAHSDLIERRARQLVEIANNLGFTTPSLPARVGNKPGPKSQILREAIASRDSLGFTQSTAEKAWEHASAKGWLRDGGQANAAI